jgi:hypothetical protein
VGALLLLPAVALGFFGRAPALCILSLARLSRLLGGTRRFAQLGLLRRALAFGLLALRLFVRLALRLLFMETPRNFVGALVLGSLLLRFVGCELRRCDCR